MLCTSTSSSSTDGISNGMRRNNATFQKPALLTTQRELYLRALEKEHEEILEEAYANKTPVSSPSASSQRNFDVDYGNYSALDHMNHSTYDDRGRQHDFRETVRQRQARLEFLRRQEFARRLAQKGREDKTMSEYAIKRLPPPRGRLAERVLAAVKIQRAYRAHRALLDLGRLHTRILANTTTPSVSPSSSSHASDEDYDDFGLYERRAKTEQRGLQDRLAKLGALGATLDVAPHTKDDPRVFHTARCTAEALRHKLEQAEKRGRGMNASADMKMHKKDGSYHEGNLGTTSKGVTVSVSSVSPDDDDFGGEIEVVEVGDGEEEWNDSLSSVSDDSDYTTEENFACYDGDGDDATRHSRTAALVALFRSASQRRQWLRQTQAQTEPATPKAKAKTIAKGLQRCPSVSRVPSLGAIPEDAEREE
ncbi:hypothetical protein DFH11DRAFT_1727142 [Phellopilus nigrolimitatus]|nr:hypothetical protein DFH11DRAFT_1727142 [Phellopilus nigrolimitatus]